jgi:hypothetical protein
VGIIWFACIVGLGLWLKTELSSTAPAESMAAVKALL